MSVAPDRLIDARRSIVALGLAPRGAAEMAEGARPILARRDVSSRVVDLDITATRL